MKLKDYPKEQIIEDIKRLKERKRKVPKTLPGQSFMEVEHHYTKMMPLLVGSIFSIAGYTLPKKRKILGLVTGLLGGAGWGYLTGRMADKQKNKEDLFARNYKQFVNLVNKKPRRVSKQVWEDMVGSYLRYSQAGGKYRLGVPSKVLVHYRKKSGTTNKGSAYKKALQRQLLQYSLLFGPFGYAYAVLDNATNRHPSAFLQKDKRI